MITNIGYDKSKQHFLTSSFLQTGFGGYQSTAVAIYASEEDGKETQLSPYGGCSVDGVCGSDYIMCVEVEVTKFIARENGGTLKLLARGEGIWSYDVCGGEYANFEVQYTLSQQYISEPTPVPNAPSPSGSHIPTVVPSTSVPTSVPTYNPTLYAGIIHEYFLNSSSNTYTPSLEYPFTNLGYDFNDDVHGEYYLSVSFLQTGFGGATNVFVDVYTLVNNVEAPLQRCSVYNNCGDQYITCFANLIVSESITKETGGTLVIGARASASWADFCGDGDGDIPFVPYLPLVMI